MSEITPMSLHALVSRLERPALAVLLLTSVHHAYGAYIYHSPWRLHVVVLAACAAAAISGARIVLRKRPTGVTGTIAFWAFATVTLVIPVALIGAFEGGYNHAVKDALYFGGTSPAVMRRLFPPPTYELPNDVFFEVTGVLQLAVAAVAAYGLYSLVRARRDQIVGRHGVATTPHTPSTNPKGHAP